MLKKNPETVLYANEVLVGQSDTEILLDFVLNLGTKGQSVVKVVVAPSVAASLGVLLQPENQPLEASQEPAAPKAKRGRKAPQKADSSPKEAQ